MRLPISQEERRQGLYIIGATGTGKSTLLANLILRDIWEDLGVCVIEPDGKLIKTVSAGIPERRVDDVILWDLADSQHPFGLNLFECKNPHSHDAVAKTVNVVQHVFEKLWGTGTDTPRLMEVLRAVARTLVENPGTTFTEIPLLFLNNAVRARMVANLTNPEIVSTWEHYNRKSQRDKDEYIESTKNKIKAFLDDPMVRNIVGQSKSTIDFRRIMDNRKILLVKLSAQFKDISLLIGGTIIGKLLLSAYSREDICEEERPQFNLYCDEFQRFATSDFAGFIAEGGRKYRVPVTIAHQTLSQLDHANRASAMTAGNMIVFRVSGEDGKALARNFDTTPTKEIIGEEPMRAPVSDVISHLVNRGHVDPRVTRFGQTFLKNFENYKIDDSIARMNYAEHGSYGFGPDLPGWWLILQEHDLVIARQLLNETLYRCMSEGSTYFLISPLALFMLAVTQRDGSDLPLLPFVKCDGWSRFFAGFEKEGEATLPVVLGDPGFLNEEFVRTFIDHRPKEEKAGAVALVNVIRELRYTMEVLAKQPILINTGQYQPKYRFRTYGDMENQVANELSQQPNYQARLKTPKNEYVIRIGSPPATLTGEQETARINYIKGRMKTFKYCKYYKEVEREIWERQEKWRGSGKPSGELPKDGPPPAWK